MASAIPRSIDLNVYSNQFSRPSLQFKACPTLLRSTFPSRTLLRTTTTALARNVPQNRQQQHASDSYSTSSSQAPAQYEALSPSVLAHVRKAYLHLFGGVLTSVSAAALGITTGILTAVPPIVFGIGALIPIFGVAMTRNPTYKRALFYTGAAFLGLGSAPLFVFGAGAGVIAPAFLISLGVFAGFTAASLLARSGSMLRWGGFFTGALIGMLVLSLGALFSPAIAVATKGIFLWGGLALFSGLVAFDTQRMIAAAQCGDTDPLDDALSLFLNFMNIFRILIQLLGND